MGTALVHPHTAHLPPPGSRARAVIATAFAYLDAASMTWVDGDGKGDITDPYDECPAAVRSH
ncbi:hypothetical protein [Saccharothrix sp. ST-888]|uniref:hypothetical protein n=1 Tax=Saccharothrix sp. ST-888 TaxID=1427391 RepID=UPI0005EC0A02|nr:hypothetical protein [Saccharothrix sp. ST-888]KJK57231.1 hypothetical protein UK12_17715 [Saccharothrix sp. ST-888]